MQIKRTSLLPFPVYRRSRERTGRPKKKKKMAVYVIFKSKGFRSSNNIVISLGYEIRVLFTTTRFN